LAPVTSVRPEDCTWIAARWITRWKAAVGTASAPFDGRDQRRQIVVDEIGQGLAQARRGRPRRPHDAGGIRLVDQRQQKMFQRGEFVAARVGKRQRAVDGLLERGRE
jgi:hypothetical protein